MDLTKAFEILSQGKIISTNSSQHSELANMLLTDSFFQEFDELINKIGYRLIGESGYFYISKKSKLSATEKQLFINRNRDLIIGIAFLRQLYPRLDRGDALSFVSTISSYENVKREDSSIRDKLAFPSYIKNKDDERTMLDMLFKHLEEKGIIEKVYESNTDKYKVLDSINYYLSIVDSIEEGDE